jgi:hypothetical protein
VLLVAESVVVRAGGDASGTSSWRDGGLGVVIACGAILLERAGRDAGGTF